MHHTTGMSERSHNQSLAWDNGTWTSTTINLAACTNDLVSYLVKTISQADSSAQCVSGYDDGTPAQTHAWRWWLVLRSQSPMAISLSPSLDEFLFDRFEMHRAAPNNPQVAQIYTRLSFSFSLALPVRRWDTRIRSRATRQRQTEATTVTSRRFGVQ